MEEKVAFTELDKSLLNLKELTDKINKNLNDVNNLIKEHINTGSGIWDSEMAKLYRERWDALMENMPDIIKTFQQQETNLSTFIENMKKTEEA